MHYFQNVIMRNLIFIFSMGFISSSWGAATTDVYGNNIGNCNTNPTTCDQVVLQNAINAAGKNDVLQLHGIFQLTGQDTITIAKPFLTLKGDLSKDSNGNPVWGTEIRGATASGIPINNQTIVHTSSGTMCGGFNLNPDVGKTFTCLRNYGISIGSPQNLVTNIEITGIKFTGHNASVAIWGGLSFPAAATYCPAYESYGVTITYDGTTTPLLYDDVANGPGSEQLFVHDNWFINDLRGVQLFGGTNKNIVVSNNIFTGSGVNSDTNNMLAFLINTRIAPCSDSHGLNSTSSNALDSVNLVPDQSLIRLENNNSDSIRQFLAGDNSFTNSTIIGNTIKNSLIQTIVLTGRFNTRSTDEDTTSINVLQNVIDGVKFGPGILIRDPNPGTRIANNTISNIGLPPLNSQPFGINFGNNVGNIGASGVKVINNTFINAGTMDVFLNLTSHDNTIIATDFNTTVSDNGTNNKLIGTLNKLGDPPANSSDSSADSSSVIPFANSNQ